MNHHNLISQQYADFLQGLRLHGSCQRLDDVIIVDTDTRRQVHKQLSLPILIDLGERRSKAGQEQCDWKADHQSMFHAQGLDWPNPEVRCCLHVRVVFVVDTSMCRRFPKIPIPRSNQQVPPSIFTQGLFMREVEAVVFLNQCFAPDFKEALTNDDGETWLLETVDIHDTLMRVVQSSFDADGLVSGSPWKVL